MYQLNKQILPRFRGTLLGKAIRIDVNVPQGRNDSYLIPPDNPFVNENGTRPEIYAYGIRNIWRCDLDEGDPVTGKQPYILKSYTVFVLCINWIVFHETM